MSLARRLRRIIRANIGAMGDDPVAPHVDPSFASERPDPTAADEAPSSGTASASSTPDVPPEVAKAYRALEVPVGSDRETVKQGYREMMKKYHQDRFQDDEEKREIAGTVSKRLNKAHDRILEYLDDAS